MRKRFNPQIYLVLDPSCCNGRSVVEVARAACRGGITLLQYRDKVGSPAEVQQNARSVLDVAREFGVPFLINDYPQIAASIGADGAHIGQGDTSPQEARTIVGDEAILGLTAFTPQHMAAVDPALVDYVGTGPVYPTKTDKGKPVLGVEGFAPIAALSPVPVVGIGGITADNALPVIKAGAAGVAMMRAISAADDPEVAARAFSDVIFV